MCVRLISKRMRYMMCVGGKSHLKDYPSKGARVFLKYKYTHFGSIHIYITSWFLLRPHITYIKYNIYITSGIVWVCVCVYNEICIKPTKILWRRHRWFMVYTTTRAYAENILCSKRMKFILLYLAPCTRAPRHTTTIIE